MEEVVFDWDESNLRKIRAHRIRRDEVEQTLANSPIAIYDQDVDGESRYVYYGETDAGRLLAIIVTERGRKIRVVTAYALDAGQRRDYLTRRGHGE
jgi:uncharacterized DUF497 family protein